MKKFLKIFLICFSVVALVSCTSFRAHLDELRGADILIERLED